MTLPTPPQSVPLFLECHPTDFGSMTAAAESVGFEPEEFCKLAIHLVVKLNLIESRVRKRS